MPATAWPMHRARAPISRRTLLRVAPGSAGAALLAAACATAGGGAEATPAPGAMGAELTWAAPGPTISDEQKTVDEAFKSKYPKVKVNYNPSADAVVFYTYLISSTAAGTPPDVINLHTFVVPEQAERNVLAPLDDFIKRDRKAVNPDDWWPAEVAMITWKGKQYALPWDFSNLGIVYNKSMFDQHAIPVPSDERWTWEDVAMLAQRFVKDEGGTRVQWGLLGSPPVDFWQTYGFVAAYSGQIASQDLKKSTWNSPPIVKMLQFFADLRQKARLHPKPSDIEPGVNLFFTGKGAMESIGSWATIHYRLNVGNNFVWDVLRYPFGSERKRTVSAAGAAASISRLTKQREAAWQWAKHYTSTESLNVMISDPIRSIPGRRSSAQRWEQVASSGGLPPKNVGVFPKMMPDAFPMPNMPYYWEARNLIVKPLHAILNDGAPIEATLGQLDQEINAIIARYTW